MIDQQNRPRIKICGMTRVEDARVAVALQVDAIGLVFYSKSPRAVSVTQARAIAKAVGPFVTVVGLFVDASREAINEVLRQVPLQVLQFHGDETQEYCQQFHRPWIKAVRMSPEMTMAQAMATHDQASGILLDSYQPGKPGGTGVTFEWERASGKSSVPIIIAGGLTPDNVAEAIRLTRPYAVDVSGGVENAPGVKDAQKMLAFVSAVNGVSE